MEAARASDGLVYVESIDPARSYNAGVIPEEAAVVHGIKDLSLDNLYGTGEPASS